MFATFDRISRDHNVAPLAIPASADPDTLAMIIYRYANPKCVSDNVDVVVDLDKMEAMIFCGFHIGGTAKLAYEIGDTRACLECGRPQHYTGTEHGWAHDATFATLACGASPALLAELER